jgi:HEAT repeat protein
MPKETGDKDKEVELLLNDLRNENPDKRKMACLALGKAKSIRAVDLLIGALNDKEMIVRECAAEALGEIGDPRAIDALINALKDKQYYVRLEAATALGQIGDVKALEPLIENMDDENQVVREKAAQAIGEICGLGDTCGIDEVGVLLQDLKDQSKGVRWRASDALVKIGRPSVEPLIAMLADKDADIKIRAAKSLGEIGDERALEPLANLLRDKDPDVRDAAGKATERIKRQNG